MKWPHPLYFQGRMSRVFGAGGCIRTTRTCPHRSRTGRPRCARAASLDVRYHPRKGPHPRAPGATCSSIQHSWSGNIMSRRQGAAGDPDPIYPRRHTPGTSAGSANASRGSTPRVTYGPRCRETLLPLPIKDGGGYWPPPKGSQHTDNTATAATGIPQTLSVFFSFWGGVQRPVASVARPDGLF